MIKPRDGVFLVVLRADCQHYAKLTLRLQIRLELIVALSYARFLTDLDMLNAVVADNAAPERVVKIERKRLFVLAKDRLYDIRRIESKLGDSVEAERILVHIPEERV